MFRHYFRTAVVMLAVPWCAAGVLGLQEDAVLLVGIVREAGTDHPLAGASVAVRSASGGSWATATGADGTFSVSGLPVGRFRVVAGKDGFVPPTWPDPGSDSKVLDLTRGSRTYVTLALSHGGVVTGTITESSGMPARRVAVSAYRSLPDNVPLTPEATTETDERGGYRLMGLRRGTYYLSATPVNSVLIGQQPVVIRRNIDSVLGSLSRGESVGRESDSAVVWGPMFYPGTARVDLAQMISVDVRAVATADFVISQARSVSIAGV